MTVLSWIRLTVCLWLLRKAVKAAGWLLLAAALWPVTVVAVTGFVAAWLRGWPPARLRRAAAGSLAVTAVWLILAALAAGGPGALTPAADWAHGWHPVTPLGSPGSSCCWPRSSSRPGCCWPQDCGRGGTTPSAPAWAAGWRRRRSALTASSGAARSAPPRAGSPPRAWCRCWPGAGRSRSAGPSARSGTAGGRSSRSPYSACARHMVIVGSTGSGKTNLMIRLWAGRYTAALDAHRDERAAGRC